MKLFEEKIIDSTCRLVRIPSVYEESPEFIFGEPINRCLDEALLIMKELGFQVFKAPDGAYGYAEIGEGELFGVLGHIDVVNAHKNDGWERNPFDPIVKDGYLYGRGVQDDKGPMMAAVYAFKALLEEGFQPKKRVRFIFGGDEETLWRCISIYKEREETPVMGFTPDSAFPLTYAEKGLLQVLIKSETPATYDYEGGDSFNAVATKASCPYHPQIEAALNQKGYVYKKTGDLLEVQGVSAHAKNPWKGISANLNLLDAMHASGIEDKAIAFIVECLKGKYRFEGFTEQDNSDFSGPITINLGKMKASKEGTVFSVDLRLPVTQKKDEIMELLRSKAAMYNLVVEPFDWLRSIHIPLESNLIQSLMGAYQEVTGDYVSKPYISAGASYARAFDNHVAFGANFPNHPTSEHQPNERIAVANLIKAAEIYKVAFKKLAFDVEGGSLSRKNASIAPSVTLEVAALAKGMREQGEDVISFSAGEPDFKTPKNIRDAAIYAIENGMTGYTAASGILELKKAICDKLLRDQKLAYDPSQIVVSCGAKHALFNALQAICNPLDEVLVPLPYWVSYPDLVRMADAKPVYIPLTQENGFSYTKEALEQAVTPKTKAIIINSPNNPTGAVYDRQVLQMIGEFATLHNLTIISDEIYESLVYEGTFTSIASISEEIKQRTIVINGLSKGYAMTGWRIGYSASDKRIANIMSNFQSHATSNPNTIAQYAGVEALNGPQEELRRFNEVFKQRRDCMVEGLSKIDSIHTFKPQGAFYVMVEVAGFYGKMSGKERIINSTQFCKYLLQNYKVAAIPGIAFGMDDYIRLSYAISNERIKEGLNRFEEFLKSLKIERQ